MHRTTKRTLDSEQDQNEDHKDTFRLSQRNVMKCLFDNCQTRK